MSQIAKKSAEVFAARAISQVSAFLVGVAIARLLGPYGKGLYAYVATILGLMVTLASGQSAAIAWQLAKGKQSPSTVYRAMLRTVALFATPIVIALIVVAVFYPGQRILLTAAAAVPFAFYAAFANGFFLSSSDVRSINVQTLIIAFVSLLSPLALFFRGGLTGLLVVWVLSYVAATVYSTLRIRTYLAPSAETAGDYPFGKQFLFGLKITANVLLEELNMRIDMFLILAMLGAGALGIYSIGIAAGTLLWQLTRPLATAAFGRIGSEEEVDAAHLTARCMRHSFAFVAVASLITFVVGPKLVVLVYGPQFATAGVVLRILLPGVVAYCLMPLLATFYAQQLSKPSVPLALSAVSTVICAAATAALIPRYGMVAGAAATSASYVVAVALGIALFVRKTGIPVLQVTVLNRDDVQQYRRVFLAAASRLRHLTEGFAR